MKMFHTIAKVNELSILYDDVEDLACLYVEAEFDEAYTDNYTKQEFVDTLRRLADSLEKYV